MSTPTRPSVLFVRAKNCGKSQMPAGLMRKIAGNTVAVDSAGTQPGAAINEISAEVLLEVGVDITDQAPKQPTDDLISAWTGSSSRSGTLRFNPSTALWSRSGIPTNPTLRTRHRRHRPQRLVRELITHRVRRLANELTTPH